MNHSESVIQPDRVRSNRTAGLPDYDTLTKR